MQNEISEQEYGPKSCMYNSIKVDVSEDYRTKFQEKINSFKTQ